LQKYWNTKTLKKYNCNPKSEKVGTVLKLQMGEKNTMVPEFTLTFISWQTFRNVIQALEYRVAEGNAT